MTWIIAEIIVNWEFVVFRGCVKSGLNFEMIGGVLAQKLRKK